MGTEYAEGGMLLWIPTETPYVLGAMPRAQHPFIQILNPTVPNGIILGTA